MDTLRFQRVVKFLAVATVAGLLMAGMMVASSAPVAADDNDVEILPPDGQLNGLSYGEWAAEWHKWVLSVPVDHNPQLDVKGKDCAEGQSGDVWFLAGVFYGSEPVTRKCRVPEDTPVFFPVINSMWFPWPDDPALDEAAVRADLAAGVEGATRVSASIDGRDVASIYDYRAQSPVFDTYVPDDNIIDWYMAQFGFVVDWPEGTSGPHLNDGVWLMLQDLDEGKHDVRFTGTFYEGEDWEWTLDVTYKLKVVERHERDDDDDEHDD